MDIEGLRALLAVVDRGSFQAAATELGVPRTRLRRQVESLESAVGMLLLHRDARGVVLTAAGEHIVRRGGALLREADTLLAGARAGRDGAVGSLRLIVPVGAPLALRQRAVTTLLHLHPGLALEVCEADDPLIHQHRPFDFLVYLGDRPVAEALHSRVVTRIRLGLMASAAYLERHGRPARVEDLAGHRLLTWCADPRRAAAWPLLGGGEQVVVPMLASANAALVAALTRDGMGIALLPLGFPLLDECEGLIPVLADAIGEETSVRLLSKRQSRTEPRLRAFFETLDKLVAMVNPGVKGRPVSLS